MVRKISLKYDFFNCFSAAPDGSHEEMVVISDPSHPRKHYGDHEGGAATGSEQPRPLRKPDPSLRELQRQISFGSGSPFGSLRKRMPPVAQKSVEGVIPPPPVAEETTSLAAAATASAATNPAEDSANVDSGDEKYANDRRGSLKHLKKELKEGVKEIKAEVKEKVRHLPDGHRGSIASITERPPYKPIEKQANE